MGGTYHDGGHHDHTTDGGIPLWAVKFFAALLMAAVCAAGCFLPVFIAAQAAQTSRLQQQQRKRSKYRLLQALLSLINCFAAGAFLGLAIIHLLPEAVLQLDRDGYLLVVSVGTADGGGTTHTYNIAYVLAALGFTAMLALEQFLAGGHAHCHQDASAALEAKEGDETAVPALPSFVDLSRCRASAHPPRSSQHPSHHHTQHHLLCTSASYCPGCDDCAEAATAAPAGAGEAAAAGAAAADATNAALQHHPQTMDGYNKDLDEIQVVGGAGECAAGEQLVHYRVEGDSAIEFAIEKMEPTKGNTTQGEESFKMFQGDEEIRTNSRETANTCSSDSLREKSSTGTQLVHPEKYSAGCTVGGQQKHVEQQTADRSDEFSVEVQPQYIPKSMHCSACEEHEEDTGHTRVCVERTSSTAAAAVAVAAEDEETKKKEETELATWDGKMSSHLLLGIPIKHDGTSSRSATNSDIISVSDKEHENETKMNRMNMSSCHNRNEEPCCTSNIHMTQTNEDGAYLSTFRGKECQRDTKTESTTATLGATAGGRSVVTSHSRCGCNNFETTDTFPPCCCCSGCCKKCGDHSHDPDSSFRVHSGSMGANVQGGDSAVKQQQGALNGGIGRPGGGTPGSDVVEKMKKEDAVNQKERELQAVYVSSPLPPSIVVHSSDTLSPRSNSIHCCGCCHRAAAGRGEGRVTHHTRQAREFVKNGGELQEQDWLGRPQDHTGKTDISVVVGTEDGGESLHNNKRSRTCGRLLKWSGRFDAAKWSLAVALGVHAIFEGVILGTTMKNQDVWIAVLAILGHKGAEGVALSSTLLRLHMTKLNFILTLGLFVLASPFGVFLGAVATVGGTGVCGIFNALAVGAVLYTTNEMLSEFAGRCSRVHRVLKLLAFTIGLGVLFGLDLLHAPFCTQHHGHSHSHQHHHHGDGHLHNHDAHHSHHHHDGHHLR